MLRLFLLQIASKSPFTKVDQSPGLGLFSWQVYTCLISSLSDLCRVVCKYIICLADMMNGTGNAAVSNYKCSTGVFACASVRPLSRYLSSYLF